MMHSVPTGTEWTILGAIAILMIVYGAISFVLRRRAKLRVIAERLAALHVCVSRYER
jgi:hypothetical protein